MRAKSGFSLLELIIAIAIIGVVAGLGFLNGRAVAERRAAQAAIATIQQSIWQGASSAAARGVIVELRRVADGFTLNIDDEVLRAFEIPTEVSTNLGAGDDGVALVFTPPGKVDVASLVALADLGEDLYVESPYSRYQLQISMIGEVVATRSVP